MTVELAVGLVVGLRVVGSIVVGTCVVGFSVVGNIDSGWNVGLVEGFLDLGAIVGDNKGLVD